MESNGNKILEALKKGTAITADAGASPPLAPDIAKRCFQQLENSYEEEYGGFRDSPKFPSPGKLEKHHRNVALRSLPDPFSHLTVNLMFLMSYWYVNHSTSEGVEALQMALHTLRMMALGGIHDHVSQVPALSATKTSLNIFSPVSRRPLFKTFYYL